MKITFLDHPRVRQLLTLVFLAGALACIFPPATPIFQWWVQHSIGVALGYVLLAVFFLLITNSRLMFVCLGCGAVISFHYNEKMIRSFEQQEGLPPQREWKIPFQAPTPGDIFTHTPPNVPTSSHR